MSMSVDGKSNKVDLLKNLNRVNWIEQNQCPVALQCICCLAKKKPVTYGDSMWFCDIHHLEWCELKDSDRKSVNMSINTVADKAVGTKELSFEDKLFLQALAKKG